MSKEQSATFEPSFSAAADQGRMVESSAERFTQPKKPKILYRGNGVTIYYRKNMRTVDNSWTGNWDQWAYA